MSYKKELAVARLPPLQKTIPAGSKVSDLSPQNIRQFDGMIGPTYTLKGGVKHPLPPPAVLRPFRDTNGGELDAWPAHAQNQMMSNISVGLNSSKALVVYNEEDVGKQNIVPKPRFLEQLEKHLKKELRALGVSEPQASDLRLQAHREVFEYLIEDFKTYKPLLAAIKNEYEVMLAHQRETIRDMEPLKQMLVTVSEQCDQKIMDLRDEEKQEISDLKAENAGLYGSLDGMRNDQKSLQAQVEKLQEELAELYVRYRDECDARKLLVADMNDLRYQQEDIATMRKNVDEDEDEEEQEDPVVLKIALRKAREDMTLAVERLNVMIADYGDVIPRRDFEALEKTHQTLTEQHSTLNDDYLKLQMEHEALLEVHKKLEQQRDEYYTEVEKLKRTATPRPDWDKFAEIVEGGQEKWDEMVNEKSSRDIAELLWDQIRSGGNIGAKETTLFFDAQGTGDDVPPYLRFEGGQIHNRKIGRRDVLLFIKDIWKEKEASDAERDDGSREPMAEYLARYLQKRFALPLLAAEWGYNLHDGAQRLQHEPRIDFFFNLLTGEADEQQHHDLMMQIAALYKRLSATDEEEGSQGALSKESFLRVLQEHFPSKSSRCVMLMAERAAEELEVREDQSMVYRNLFTEDEEGGTGPFLQELRRQDAEEREQYVNDIQEALGENTEVSPELLQQAVKATDPSLEEVALHRLLATVFRPSSETALHDCPPLDLQLVARRLKYSTVRRAGPKPPLD